MNQNLNVLQLCHKHSTRVEYSKISETFANASSLHSEAVHNFNNDKSRFICVGIPDNPSRLIRSRDDEERKGFSKMMWKLLQYQGAPEVEIDKFNGNKLDYHYFVSMFNQVVEKKVSDKTGG